jgi:hypothetical protein
VKLCTPLSLKSGMTPVRPSGVKVTGAEGSPTGTAVPAVRVARFTGRIPQHPLLIYAVVPCGSIAMPFGVHALTAMG